MCKIAGLRDDPFTSHSAENETSILDEIFYIPPFYDGLKSTLKGGSSRFILGQRGHGKSMLIHHLRNALYREGCLPVVIDKYDEIPTDDNEQYFLYQIAQAITMSISEKVIEGTLHLDNVDKHLKNKFAVLVEMFYDKKWAPTFMEKMESIQEKKLMNRIKSIFNCLFKKPLDDIAATGMAITTEYIRQSIFGNNFTPPNEEVKRSYFPGLSISEFKTLDSSDAKSIPVSEYKNIISVLLDILKSTRLKSAVVLFDKVDEYAPLKSDSKKVASFSSSLLLDTDLLYKLSVVFSLWSGSRNELNNIGVRFDKFPCMDIRWDNKDLEGIVDKRLYFYSKDKNNPVTLKKLISKDELRKELFKLSEKSPRNILILLNEIQSKQHGEHVESFSDEAVGEGMLRFCKQYDFQAARTSKKGINNWVNKLLTMRKNSFTVDEYHSTFNISKKQAINHIKTMRDMDLVRLSMFATDKGDKMYEVIDPRIVHLMSRGVMSLD